MQEHKGVSESEYSICTVCIYNLFSSSIAISSEVHESPRVSTQTLKGLQTSVWEFLL